MRAKAAENNGYIPITVLLTFNRIKESTSDLNLITEVLKSIPDLEVVDGKVKRTKPCPDTFDFKSNSNCTVLLRGFSHTEPMVTIDEVTELIIPYSNPINIFRKRHYQTKEFKGKVLVQFNTPEEAQKVLDVKELNFKDQKISIMTQEQYIQIKTEELAKLGITYQKPGPKRQKEKSEKTSQRKFKRQKKDEIIKTPTTEPKKEEIIINKGLLIEVKNVPLGIPLTDLKAYFARFGTVQFIDLSKRDEHQLIMVRFSNPTETNLAYGEISEKKKWK
jgi:lupus La protein